MPAWRPGQSGNARGRLSEQEATSSLRLVVHEIIEGKKDPNRGKKKLRVINERIAEAAMEGEPWACQMIHDRLDGKPMQFIDQQMTVEAGEVFIDLLKQLNAHRGKLIEHDRTERTHTNGKLEGVRD